MLCYCSSSPVLYVTNDPPDTCLATDHALVAVATMPFNPDVIALFCLAYHSRAGTEVESEELTYPVRENAP